ncbi:MAG: LytR/AlgR family response regulator transcription factor [Phascolarctobacterium sp.]
MRIVLCDDDTAILESTQALLEQIFRERCINVELATFTSYEQCYQYLQNSDTDILILDIYLGQRLGTDLALRLRQQGKKFKLIFLTTSNEFASESFAAEASYYLLKPLTKEALLKGLDHCLPTNTETPIAIDTGRTTLHLNPAKIIMVEVQDKYCFFYTTSGVIKEYCTFTKVLEALTQPYFLSVHRSAIINMHFVERLEDDVFYLKNGSTVTSKIRGGKAVKDKYMAWLFENM